MQKIAINVKILKRKHPKESSLLEYYVLETHLWFKKHQVSISKQKRRKCIEI